MNQQASPQFPPEAAATSPPADASAPATAPAVGHHSFSHDFRRFFQRGLATLLPTLITLWLLTWLWNFLWTSIGQHVIFSMRWMWLRFGEAGLVDKEPAGYIRHVLNEDVFGVRILGVGLSVLLVYLVGFLVGNLIGRTMYRIAERAVLKVPLLRAIYPAVKQVTDFILADKKTSQFASSRVVAVQARAQGIWSIGFVTGQGYGPLNQATNGDMLTIFVPSTPTAFSGYVVVAHREAVVELPLSVEETMRLLLSGGVIVPPVRPDGSLVSTPEGVVQTLLPADVSTAVGGASLQGAGPMRQEPRLG